MLDGYGDAVEEETMVASSRTRPDQPPLDKIGILLDWTAVDTTDHYTDHSSDHEDDGIPPSQVNDFSSFQQQEPHGEPVVEDAVVAGAAVSRRSDLLGDETFVKLSAAGPPVTNTEDAIKASETAVFHAAPRTTSSADANGVDRAVAAPSRKHMKEGWVGQAARSDEFSWLAAAEPSGAERRASVDSVNMTDAPVPTEISAPVENALPLPAVSEGALKADVKASAKFDVDFGGLLAQPKFAVAVRQPAVVQSQPLHAEVAEDQIMTTKVSGRKFDDFLTQSKIEFMDRTASDSDERDSLAGMEIGLPEREEVRPVTPGEEQLPGPSVEEESVIPQSKRSGFVIPDFPVGAEIQASPKTKKSGGVFGFFRRRSKNEDQNNSAQSPKNKSNSLDKRTTEKQAEAERPAGSTLPADGKKDNGRGARFRMGFNFGFGGSKDKRGSPAKENQGGRSPKVQSPRANNSSGDAAKSPSKTNIRVFEIMAGQQNGANAGVGAGLKEQQAPPTGQQGPSVIGQAPPITTEITTTPLSSPTPMVVATPPERPPPVVEVQVSAPVAPTVPAFSSQYMVAVAIDFGKLFPVFSVIC